MDARDVVPGIRVVGAFCDACVERLDRAIEEALGILVVAQAVAGFAGAIWFFMRSRSA